MAVSISTHITIEGADVDDAKRQLIALFGVSLGQVVFAAGADDPKPVLLASSALTPPLAPQPLAPQPLDATATGQANLAAQGETAAEQPARRRRTRAEIEAAKTPEPGGALAPVNGAAVAAEPEAEDEIDLLSGGANGAAAAEDPVDPLADESLAKPKPAAASRTLTKADMMEAGKAVLDKHGMQKLTDILKQHGHTRVAALAEHSYPTVMADFEEALA